MTMQYIKTLFQAFARRKTFETEQSTSTQLIRTFGLADLTLFGVGSTLGVGAYVLAGKVAHDTAGPAVIVSFFIAAVVSLLSGICYAEFAARVPKAGSAYIYSYVTVGELIAYIIGWTMLLEYCIGTAGVARSMSAQFDALTNGTYSSTMKDWLPMHIEHLSAFPDFLSAGIIIALCVLVGCGVKESKRANNLFTVVNLIVIFTVVIAGLFSIKTSNWSVPSSESSPNSTAVINDGSNSIGNGGFLPFGWTGVMKGAATCFFGFIGFDCIATTGEEAKKPQRNIPLAIILALVLVFFSYVLVACTLTLMLPYYEQNIDAPFPHAFEQVGMPYMKVIVTIGSLFALSASILGALFPLVRVFYAMSSDGLIYNFLSQVNPTTKTPLYATIVSGILASTMALFFNLDQLMDMMSSGTLLAYCIVCMCVLTLRYRKVAIKKDILLQDQNEFHHENGNGISNGKSKKDFYSLIKNEPEKIELSDFFSISVLLNFRGSNQATKTTEYIAVGGVIVYSFMAFWTSYILKDFETNLVNGDLRTKVIFGALILFALISFLIICRQPQVVPDLFFKAPLVPFLPCLSIFFNCLLMMQLSPETWYRFGFWMIIGVFVYLSHSMRHSKEARPINTTS